MTVSHLAEIIERFYYSGRVKVTNKELSRRDFLQLSKIAWANLMRQIYFESKKSGEGDEYYFFAADLITKRFTLTEADCRGKRRADMSEFDVFRLPKNSHIQNVSPVNAKGCEIKEITQVQPAEENFYIGDPNFKCFSFFVVKGKGIDTYNIPPCIQKLDVESIFDTGDIDVSQDMAFDIFNIVFGESLKIKGFPINPQDDPYDPQARTVKQMLAQDKQTL